MIGLNDRFKTSSQTTLVNNHLQTGKIQSLKQMMSQRNSGSRAGSSSAVMIHDMSKGFN